MRWAYAVTTYSGAMLVETIHSIPKGTRLLVVDNSQHDRSLSWCWNYAIERLCLQEGYDVAICMNDDVVLRWDTGEDLARGLLEYQHTSMKKWTSRELLLLSARHAAPSDARTNEVDSDLLEAAETKFEPGPDFACFATTARLLSLVGHFDEGMQLYHEDNDMHRRIQLAGYEAGAFAPYWHFLNGTIRTNPELGARARALFEQSKQRYIDRWGGYLGQERFTTPYGN
jgi:hypothetical protein